MTAETIGEILAWIFLAMVVVMGAAGLRDIDRHGRK